MLFCFLRDIERIFELYCYKLKSMHAVPVHRSSCSASKTHSSTIASSRTSSSLVSACDQDNMLVHKLDDLGEQLLH